MPPSPFGDSCDVMTVPLQPGDCKSRRDATLVMAKRRKIRDLKK
jgi:hypothetical protein